MLAFVFWHWPYPQIDVRFYEQGLREFHANLARTRPQGFVKSAVFRSSGAAWAVAEHRPYEDWYVVESAASLDPLNEGAVQAPAKESHDRAAQAAASGTGGLYQLKAGGPDLLATRFATWLAKPRETSYRDFYSQLAPWSDLPGVSLWRRYLVLGPTPEFTLLSPGDLELPTSLGGVGVSLELVWP